MRPVPPMNKMRIQLLLGVSGDVTST
jgi:hypothetical protein